MQTEKRQYKGYELNGVEHPPGWQVGITYAAVRGHCGD
jgi:hypothetical protein